MRLSAEVVDTLIELVRSRLDEREGISPEDGMLGPRLAAHSVAEELEREVLALQQKIEYYAPPEHVDASVVEIVAVALTLAGLAGKVAKNALSQDGTTG